MPLLTFSTIEILKNFLKSSFYLHHNLSRLCRSNLTSLFHIFLQCSITSSARIEPHIKY